MLSTFQEQFQVHSSRPKLVFSVSENMHFFLKKGLIYGMKGKMFCVCHAWSTNLFLWDQTTILNKIYNQLMAFHNISLHQTLRQNLNFNSITF